VGSEMCIRDRLRILWEEIMNRFEDIEVVGDPVYLRSSFIRGIRELPVVVRRK